MNMSIYLSIYPSANQPINPINPINQPISQSTNQSVSILHYRPLSFYPSIFLSIYQSIYLSISLSIHLSRQLVNGGFNSISKPKANLMHGCLKIPVEVLSKQAYLRIAMMEHQDPSALVHGDFEGFS